MISGYLLAVHKKLSPISKKSKNKFLIKKQWGRSCNFRRIDGSLPLQKPSAILFRGSQNNQESWERFSDFLSFWLLFSSVKWSISKTRLVFFKIWISHCLFLPRPLRVRWKKKKNYRSSALICGSTFWRILEFLPPRQFSGVLKLFSNSKSADFTNKRCRR